jgi:ATP-dependent DNA helicase PIF1
MTTKNLNISKRAMNGSLAIVTSITFHHNKVVTSIIIKIVSTNIEMMLKRPTIQHKYTSKIDYYKTSFPIVLAYAIIGHKAQGATIKSKVFIHIKKSFARSLTYVMLSRIINHSHLLIFENLNLTHFKCIYQG